TGPIAKGWGEWFDPSLGQGMQKAEGHMWSGAKIGFSYLLDVHGRDVHWMSTSSSCARLLTLTKILDGALPKKMARGLHTRPRTLQRLPGQGSSTSLCTKRSAPAFLRSGRHRTMVTIESDSDFYDVFEILGKGTFGEVVKSWKRSTGEMVAIKILKNDSYRSRIIKNELKLLQTMSEVDTEAAHIVQFHEFFHDELKFYLVFELLEQNLFDFQKEHNFSPLAVRHIRTVTTQVLRALAKLKELSIIHADLKPENIMLVDQVRFPFRVKVIDFGSASIFSEVRYVKEPYIQSRFYRAPEILLGLPFCEKVDVWSLGCVMAELHLGWPLYPGNNEYDQIRYICETQGMPRPTLLNAARKESGPLSLSVSPAPGKCWLPDAPSEPGHPLPMRPRFALTLIPLWSGSTSARKAGGDATSHWASGLSLFPTPIPALCIWASQPPFPPAERTFPLSPAPWAPGKPPLLPFGPSR
uniref:Homeodomain interacting protein kinase 4 n=1 Tax=Varanus komodoensis TaxID=61221 RepID=A0A8D2LQ83_VARKO